MCGDKPGVQSDKPSLRNVFRKYINTKGITGAHYYPLQLELPGETTTLFQMIEQIANFPFNFLVPKIDPETGQYKLTLLLKPLVSNNLLEPNTEGGWANLKSSIMDRMHTQSYNIHRTMKDSVSVTNVFMPEIAFGTSPKEQFAMSLEALEGKDFETRENSPIQINEDAMRRFGYRPLDAEVRFYDFQVQEKDFNAEKELPKAAKQLAAMYKHNHEFYSGRVVTMDDFQDDFCWQHHIGQKLVMDDIGTGLIEGKLTSAEFFIEGIDYRGGYGIPPTATFGLTRGANYYQDGSFAGKIYGQQKISRSSYWEFDE